MLVQTSPETRIHLDLVKQSSSSESSPLLAFLHYWGGSSSTWHKLTTPDQPTSIASRFTSVSITNRGWSPSTGPTPETGATGKEYSVTPLASDLANVLQHLLTNDTTRSIIKSNGIVLIGHSMGAKVALAVHDFLSDELLGLIKGVVLVAPAPPTPLILPSDMREQQIHAYDTPESVQFVVSNVLSSTTLLTQRDLDMVQRDSLAGSVLAKEGWIEHGMQEDLTSVLDRISQMSSTNQVKVRVLAGELDVVEPPDRVYNEVVQKLIARGFNVDFSIVQGAKHLIPLEYPEAIAQAIEHIVA